MLTPPSSSVKQQSGHYRNKLYVGIEKTMSPLLMFGNMMEEEEEDSGDIFSRTKNEENQSPVSVLDIPTFIDTPSTKLIRKNDIQKKVNEEEEEEETLLYEIPVLFMEDQDESSTSRDDDNEVETAYHRSRSSDAQNHSRTDSLISVVSAAGALPAIPEDRPDNNIAVEDDNINMNKNEHEEDVPLKDLVLLPIMMSTTTNTATAATPVEPSALVVLSDNDSTHPPNQESTGQRYQRKYFPSPRLLGMKQSQSQSQQQKEQFYSQSSDNDANASVIPTTTVKTTISSPASSSTGQTLMSYYKNHNDKNRNHHSLSSSPSSSSKHYQHQYHRRVRSLPTTSTTTIMSAEISSPIAHEQKQKNIEQKLVSTIQQYGTETHIEVVQLYSQLGTSFFHQEHYTEAADQYMRALNIIQTLKGGLKFSKKKQGKRLSSNHHKQHSLSLSSITNLEAVVCTNYGTTLWHLHEFRSALRYFQCVYDIRKHQCCGSSEHGNATYYLGCAYFLLLMQTKHKNSDDDDDGMTYCITRGEINIARKALKVLKEALMIQMKQYCYTQSYRIALDVTRTMNLLSLLYKRFGQTEEAMKWSRRANQIGMMKH